MNEVKLNDATGPTKDLGSGTEYSEWGGLYLTLKTAKKRQTNLSSLFRYFVQNWYTKFVKTGKCTTLTYLSNKTKFVLNYLVSKSSNIFLDSKYLYRNKFCVWEREGCFLIFLKFF